MLVAGRYQEELLTFLSERLDGRSTWQVEVAVLKALDTVLNKLCALAR